ncbi:MAG: hypothetical protein A2096_00780 [Spirochaetes bacterium GWF1_41_5]|nr:MAG: hypothetical protein A2096_00780 [Spirochaetes bacterium GWF1_41_5]HBE03544.1 hypothetical protein [Spirochaetia bacterium]
MKYLFFILLLPIISCKATYQNNILINTSVENLFAAVSDYEKFPMYVPEFHQEVKIISTNRAGKDVQFYNMFFWGKFKIESTYLVSEFKKNEYIRLENLSQYGITEFKFEKIDANMSKYILINHVKAPSFIRKNLFKSYDKELIALKAYCESNFK